MRAVACVCAHHCMFNKCQLQHAHEFSAHCEKSGLRTLALANRFLTIASFQGWLTPSVHPTLGARSQKPSGMRPPPMNPGGMLCAQTHPRSSTDVLDRVRAARRLERRGACATASKREPHRTDDQGLTGRRKHVVRIVRHLVGERTAADVHLPVARVRSQRPERNDVLADRECDGVDVQAPLD